MRGYAAGLSRKVFTGEPCPGSGRDPFIPAALLKGQFICMACHRLYGLRAGKIAAHGYRVDWIWK